MGSAWSLQLSLVFACLIGTPHAAAQSWTAEEFTPYTDQYGLIHDKPPTSEVLIPSGNGLLYTAEACVIMQLSKVSYDRKKIADGVRDSQVKSKPGLFNRGPTKLNDLEDHDDYIGLGALSNICGFRDVARAILSYGRGSDQSSGASALRSDCSDFGFARVQLNQCKTVPYNYNNVEPGKFCWSTWMGKSPDIITHLKLAAGERPTQEELSVWAAVLIYNGQMATLKKDEKTPWLLSWLMVLTYQLAQYHSTTADYAAVEWWKLLHARFPDGGIKQAMTEYLSEGAKHPLAKHIENFEDLHHRDPTMVDKISIGDPQDLFRTLNGILTNNCGPTSLRTCLDYRNYSPANLLTQFDKASQLGVSVLQERIAHQKRYLDAEAGVLEFDKKFFASFSQSLTKIEGDRANLQQQVNSAVSRLNEIIAKVPQPPGMCFRSPCNNPILCPPSTIPCAVFDNATYQSILKDISDAQGMLKESASAIEIIRPKVEAAGQDLDRKIAAFDELNKQVASFVDQLQGELTKARAVAEAANGFGVAIANTLSPCPEVLDASPILEPAIKILPPPGKN
jgi:hypothetical protein